MFSNFCTEFRVPSSTVTHFLSGLLPDQSLHFLYKETSLSDAQGPNVAIEALSNKQ